jgi:hypothetical protein
MTRRFVTASAIAVVVAAALLTGSGVGPSFAAARGRQAIPAGLAGAIHARFGLWPLRSADSPTEHPEMGFSVAMSQDGTTALVSAVGAGNQKGAAYVYHVADAGSWASSATPVATLSGRAPGGLGEGLGFHVALSADGTTAFASAPFGFRSGLVGAVQVFHVASESAWASTSTPTATLTVNNGGVFGFGIGGLAVSPDGTTLVAGDPSYNSAAGAGYVFHASTENAWASTSTPTATLTNAADTSEADAGWGEIAISGDGATVLLGATASLGGVGSGYLFHVASEAAWASSSTPTAILSNASGVFLDRLGWGVALSDDGTTAFLGALGVNGYRGAVDVFHVADAAGWASTSTPAAILTKGGAAKYSYVGDTLALSADGTTVVTGADGVNHSTGAVYVFRASAEDAWTSSATPTAALTDSSGASNDLLGGIGLATSSDGATVLVGAPGVNWQTGKADVFHVADAGSWVTGSTPTAMLTNSALPKPRCIVPRLTKYHVPFAKEVLSDANCRLGKVRRVHSTRKNRRLVVSQSPHPGRNLPPGSKVNVKIGK